MAHNPLGRVRVGGVHPSGYAGACGRRKLSMPCNLAELRVYQPRVGYELTWLNIWWTEDIGTLSLTLTLTLTLTLALALTWLNIW